MLNNPNARHGVAKYVDPVARGLIRIGVTPDMVTYAGTIGVAATALWFFPRGEFVVGTLVILLFVFSDLLDGTMARMLGTASPWGNFLDSTLDRLADGAIFGGILIFFATRGYAVGTAAMWVVTVGAFVISYAKARAESLGADAKGGIAERAERQIWILALAFVQGIVFIVQSPDGYPWVLTVAAVILAILVIITIGQRFNKIKGQLHHPAAPHRAPPEAVAS